MRLLTALWSTLLLLLFLSTSASAATTRIPDPAEWHLYQAGAPTAWAQGADGHGVSVLVIDTGLDGPLATLGLSGSTLPGYAAPLHETFEVPCPGAVPGKYDDMHPCTKTVIVPNPARTGDMVGHGTFVACEIACHVPGLSYYGIAPAARVAMARVFLGAGADTRDIAAAIRWGVTRHFPILSMSLGALEGDAVLRTAVAFAVAHGTLVVAAAGNEAGTSPEFPAAYPGVIAVGATGPRMRRASFSNYGPGLALTAPGVGVVGLATAGTNALECHGVCPLNGTSMATPLVAGALADLLSLGVSPVHARAALLAGAIHWPNMPVAEYGAGVLSVSRSVTYARTHGWVQEK